MSDLIFLIETEDFKKLYDKHIKPFVDAGKEPEIMGLVLYPSVDYKPGIPDTPGTPGKPGVYQPIFYLNPVYPGAPDQPDSITLVNMEKACPYPPGYTK